MRSVWKGALSFGLVNIPVHMYTASHTKEISFKLLHKKDHSEIRYAKVCKTEEKEVPWEEIVKAYEFEEGEFIIFDEKDFEKVNQKKTKTIEITGFVHENEIDSLYYVKPYYLEPDKNSEKVYALLREALKKSKKVAIAKYVIRNREHMAVIKIHDNILVLNELRYHEELASTEELHIPEVTKGNSREVQMAMQLIEHLTTTFKPEKYKDTYVEEIKKIIKQKSKGKVVHTKTKEVPPTKFQDIMELLKAGLETDKKPKKRKTA